VPLVHGGAAAAATNEAELGTAATALDAVPATNKAASAPAAAALAKRFFDDALRLMSHSPLPVR